MAQQNTRNQETGEISQTKSHILEPQNETVEVLYQKMGNRWFAFSLIDDEVFVGSISEDEIEAAAEKNTADRPTHKIVGNT